MTGILPLKKESQKPNMGPEDVVVQEVVRYFSTPKFERFSTETEYAIQIGSYKGRTDVALVDTDGALAAIIECKRSGYEGSGPEQLKSYLSATDTSLGIFANETNPAAWRFYENLGQNQFKPIGRSRFEARLLKRGVIRTLRESVRSLFRRQREESSPIKPPSPESFNPPTNNPDRLNITHIAGDRSLQNDNNTDLDPSLNGKPYYSEASGFYWAANHHGIPECVPQHVKRIISDEELRAQFNREQLQAEIDELVQEKNGLEAQQREYEREIGQRSQDFAPKREELAGLEVQLGAPTETELNPSPVEALDQDDAKQQLDAEISQLREEKDRVQREIEEKSQLLARKGEKLAELEVQLGAPTETELTPAPESVPQVHAKKWYAWMSRIPAGLVASVVTVVLIALAVYLFIFYASAVDKAFFLHEDKIQQQVEEGTYAGVQDIVNPKALFMAWQKGDQGRNYFVLFFPWVFLAFALAFDHFWESGKMRWVIGLGVVTFVFDVLLAIHISLKIHLARKYIAERMGDPTPTWPGGDDFLDIGTVIFCGFVASLLVSVLYNVTRDRWKQVKQFQPQSKEQEIREVQIRDEKVQRDAQIAVLRTEMENVEGEIGPLQGEISRLNEKVRTTQQKIDEWSREQLEDRIKAERSPIEARIACLNVEIEALQGEIDQLNDKVKSTQQRIDRGQAKIEELSDLRNKRIINGHQMELRVNRFLNGWCRFVANNEDGRIDVSAQINRIKQVAYETLNQYYEDLEGYSSQSRGNSTVEI